MSKDSIIQFIGFITSLETEKFLAQWEPYAKDFNKITSPENMTLQQEVNEKSKYRFISLHEYKNHDFEFNFMKGKSSVYFPEQKVRVVQAGGYAPVQIGSKYQNQHRDVKILVFLSHDEYDIAFYQELSSHKSLSIYRAYYESCAYGNILEYYTAEEDAGELLQQLKMRPCAEAAAYKDCLLPKALKLV